MELCTPGSLPNFILLPPPVRLCDCVGEGVMRALHDSNASNLVSKNWLREKTRAFQLGIRVYTHTAPAWLSLGEFSCLAAWTVNQQRRTEKKAGETRGRRWPGGDECLNCSATALQAVCGNEILFSDSIWIIAANTKPMIQCQQHKKKLSKAFSPKLIYCQTLASNIYDLWAVAWDTVKEE